MTNAAFEIDWINHVLREADVMTTKHTEDPYFIIGYLEQALRGAARAIDSLGDRDQSTEGPLHDHALAGNPYVPRGHFREAENLSIPSNFPQYFYKQLLIPRLYQQQDYPC